MTEKRETSRNRGFLFYWLYVKNEIERGDFVGKVLIATFGDEEEMDLEELILFLKKKSNIVLVNTSSNNGLLEYDNFAIDPKFRTVKVNGQNVELTNYEFDILYLFAKNPGQVFSKEQIYSQVWKTPYYGAEDNVMSLIRRIRKKIEPNPAKPFYILTVWGIGYKFNNAIQIK